jgi:hypothetical protein
MFGKASEAKQKPARKLNRMDAMRIRSELKLLTAS